MIMTAPINVNGRVMLCMMDATDLMQAENVKAFVASFLDGTAKHEAAKA